MSNNTGREIKDYLTTLIDKYGFLREGFTLSIFSNSMVMRDEVVVEENDLETIEAIKEHLPI